MGVTVFTPCVALNTVIGVPYYASIMVITFISIIFTLLGGLKAAIIADVIQSMTMILVSIAIIIQGTYETGSVKKVIDRNKEDGEIYLFYFHYYNLVLISLFFQ